MYGTDSSGCARTTVVENGDSERASGFPRDRGDGSVSLAHGNVPCSKPGGSDGLMVSRNEWISAVGIESARPFRIFPLPSLTHPTSGSLGAYWRVQRCLPAPRQRSPSLRKSPSVFLSQSFSILSSIVKICRAPPLFTLGPL